MRAYIDHRRAALATPRTPGAEQVERGRRAETLHQQRIADALAARKRRPGG